MFIVFGASISGFQYMRKVIVVDGTHLQGKYKGTLLLATAQDGTLLNYVISDDRGLAIISDMHIAIGNAIRKVYPLATREIFTYHLYKNILQRFRGGESFKLVKKAAKAYRVYEFNAIFEVIGRVNPGLHAYLQKAGVQCWARVYFQGDRYNFTTTNIAESIKKVLSEARSLPVMQLIDAIRSMLNRWFAERHNDAGVMKTVLTQGIEKLLAGQVERCKDLTIQEIDAHQFEVGVGGYVNVVNLTQKKCTCRMLDL
ncbi:uncharacterized protein LOC112087528 [Eutrema salsugineum]|uniref:uncharacterized protein LOC112087528 n=1 Tax=Eutrema salsugineum TaxID=72664 RepID=UPI000CECE89F|nr:uncharacterized protein LOC112087528 [Eutrema salsugineum]